MRMNGWQRLWVVLILLWGVVVGTVVYLTVPRPMTYLSLDADAPEREEILARLKQQSLPNAHSSTTFQANYVDEPLPPIGGRILKRYGVTDPITGRHFEIQSDHIPTENELLSAEISELEKNVQQDRTNTEKQNREEAAGRHDARVALMRNALLVWLIPAGCLYALGWSIGWIRRGFRHAL